MSDVVAELATIGITQPRQVSQTMVTTMPESRFTLASTPIMRNGEMTTSTQCDITGTLVQSPDKPDWQLLEILVKATETDPTRRDGGGPGRIELANLTTTLTMPYGHFVVLGATPTGDMTYIFVIQVTRVD